MPTGPEFGRVTTPKLPHRSFPVRGKLPRGIAKALSPNIPPVSGPEASKPSTWPGSDPEWYVYWALNRLGLHGNLDGGVDFSYQAAQMGGRAQFGGAVLDFLVSPNIGINVQGEHFHYGMGPEKQATDQQQAIRLIGHGIQMEFIDAEPLIADPSGQAAIQLVKDAINGIDHSQMRNGLL